MLRIKKLFATIFTWIMASGVALADSLTWNDVGVDTNVNDAVSTGQTLIKWAVYILVSLSLAGGAYFGIKGFWKMGKSGEQMHGQNEGVGKLFGASAGLIAFAILIGVIYATLKKAATGGF